MILHEFLSQLNKTKDNIMPADIYSAAKDKKFNNYFTQSNLLKLIEEAFEIEFKDNSIPYIFYNIYLNFQLIKSENEIKSIIEKYKDDLLDDSELIEAIDDYLTTSGYPLLSVIMEIISDYDIKGKINDKIKKKILAPFKYLSESVNQYTVPVLQNYLDMFYKIRTTYFDKYEENLFEDSTNVRIAQNKLNELFKFEIPDLNIKPESIGLLDITKLK